MIEISGYEVGEEIGKGGMATVYLGKHVLLERQVAIKVLTMGGLPDEGFHKSFITEGQTIARLEHPHIVKIYDIGIENERFFMAMEYAKQGTLKERLQEAPPSLQENLPIIEQIASALSYAHSQNYIHRDIKPANILFRDNGEAVLTDFGIAKLQGSASEMTQMGFMAGTPHYMAPEQATGDEVDGRTDQYSLAIVFYEMLTGEKPFEGENTVAITYQHAHSEVPRLESKFSLFQAVFDKALAKKKEDRFNDVDEFVNAIKQKIVDDDPTVIQPTISPANQAAVDSYTTMANPGAGEKKNIGTRTKELALSVLLACSLFFMYFFLVKEENGAQQRPGIVLPQKNPNYDEEKNEAQELPPGASQQKNTKYDEKEVAHAVTFIKQTISKKKLICRIQKKIVDIETRNEISSGSDLRLSEDLENIKRDLQDQCKELLSKNNINKSRSFAGNLLSHLIKSGQLNERDMEDFSLIYPDGFDISSPKDMNRVCTQHCE